MAKPFGKGSKHSEQTKRKISEAKMGGVAWNKGRRMPQQKINRIYGSPLSRFWRKVKIKDLLSCWEWQASTKLAIGYGQIRWKGRLEFAHRVAWEIRAGRDVPDNMHVLHKCDNPLCVNPNQLFLGTPADNAADKVAKGRQAKGTQMPQAKVTEADVLKIRNLWSAGGLSQKLIGEQFGVSQSLVSRIVTANIWKHVELQGG